MLCFEIGNAGREIQVDCDEGGMGILINALEKLRAGAGHMYLRTASNGGCELDDKSPWGVEGIGEVIISWVGD